MVDIISRLTIFVKKKTSDHQCPDTPDTSWFGWWEGPSAKIASRARRDPLFQLLIPLPVNIRWVRANMCPDLPFFNSLSGYSYSIFIYFTSSGPEEAKTIWEMAKAVSVCLTSPQGASLPKSG